MIWFVNKGIEIFLKNTHFYLHVLSYAWIQNDGNTCAGEEAKHEANEMYSQVYLKLKWVFSHPNESKLPG